jgi:pre-rRNA-processing protein IPI1
MHSWYLASSFTRPEAYASFEELLQPAQERSSGSDCRTWKAEVKVENDDFICHYTFLSCNQPYLDSVLADVGITKSQVDSPDINYTFIDVSFSSTIFFFSYNFRRKKTY